MKPQRNLFIRTFLTALLLVLVNAAPAESFYLLSKQGTNAMPPLPFNPQPNAPRHQIVEDIWLVNDTGASNAAAVEETLQNLRTRIDDTRMAAVLNEITNPPPKLPPVVYRPPPTNYFNTTNATRSGILLLESVRPGIKTNFPAALLDATNTPPNSGWLQRMKKLPPHISKNSPTYKEDLEKWKKEQLPEAEKGRGGGDVPFDETAPLYP